MSKETETKPTLIDIEKTWQSIADDIKKQREDRLRELGYNPLFTPEVGENDILVKPQNPVYVETRNGMRLRLTVVIDGENRTWLVNPKVSVLMDKLINHFIETPDDPLLTTLVRSGLGLDTRYSFKD